ncbi:MAG: zinc metalloprotease HtpX, partial [Betaproteobacteria bacterium]|nr:zinc metalloprotease HtpX [Betaproteobacteria bacterium]
MLKRIFLFVATNVAVIFILNLALTLLGIDRLLDESGAGINVNALLV